MFHDRDRHAKTHARDTTARGTATRNTEARDTALACLEAGVEAALPERVVAGTVERNGETLRVLDAEYDLSSYDEILVLGGGKAAGGVAAALLEVLGDRIDGGVVVTTGVDRRDELGRIDVREGDHPTPTRRNVEATGDLLESAESAGDGTLVLAIVTGGASALLCAPAGGGNAAAGGLTLEELRGTTDALLGSGATIDEVNAVRKHCSAIKGGRLAATAAPATVVTLAISDVVGDDPAVVGSGPTVPDPTTFADARAVLGRYGIEDAVPSTVVDRLEAGVAGEIEETPAGSERGATDVTDGVADGVSDADYHPLANGRTAIDAARDVARDRGYQTLVLSSRVRGEAREVGRVHAAVAEEIRATGDPVAPPAVVLSGGEVTVTVRGDGTGGPNQELALAAAIEFAESGTEAVLASVDTDGIDGPTEAAGAIVARETVADDQAGARATLVRNDAARYLAERGALLETGRTGTNVNDLRVLVVGGSD